MSAPLYELVTNPWMVCGRCCGEVHARNNGRNVPCGCVAEAVSICPSWDPYYGCQCSTMARADAFQAMLEEQETGARPGASRPRLLSGSTDVIEQAHRIRIAARQVFAWAALLVAMLVAICLAESLL